MASGCALISLEPTKFFLYPPHTFDKTIHIQVLLPRESTLIPIHEVSVTYHFSGRESYHMSLSFSAGIFDFDQIAFITKPSSLPF